MKSGVKSSSGFTLMEVVISLAIFAYFISAYMVVQGHNISDSARSTEDLGIQRICQNKINEIIIAPPELRDSLTLMAKTEKIEEEQFSDYQLEIEYRRLEIPNLNEIMGNEKSNKKDNTIKEKIFKQMKKNIEAIIWQVEVRVMSKITNTEVYALSTWLYNRDAKIKIKM